MKMLRRGLLIMMIVTSFLAFAACKKNDGNGAKEKDTEVNSKTELDADKEKYPEPTVDVPEVTENPDTKEEQNGTKEEDKEYIPDFIHKGEPFDYTQYNFYTADLYVKAPAYHEVSHGLKNFHYGMNITIGYFAGRGSDITEFEIETPEDIMDNMKERLIRGTKRYVYGDYEKLEFDSIETLTINDIEMVRYEGRMTVKGFEESNKRYVVAYTFIYNETPNAIFGVVGSAYQEQEFIDELIHNMDETVKTIVPKNQ